MIIIENSLIPFKGFSAMAIYGLLFTRNRATVTKITQRHEAIHTWQQLQVCIAFLLLLLPLWLLSLIPLWFWLFFPLIAFFVLYFVEWIARLFMPGNAYRNISFEREAYANQENKNYFEKIKLFSFIKKKKKIS
jgi:hypothetical protein